MPKRRIQPKRKRRGEKESLLVKAAYAVEQRITVDAVTMVAKLVGEIHAGMIPPVMASVGKNLIAHAMCLDVELTKAGVVQSPSPSYMNGITSQLLMVEHVLGEISKIAAKHGLAVSYRIAEAEPK